MLSINLHTIMLTMTCFLCCVLKSKHMQIFFASHFVSVFDEESPEDDLEFLPSFVDFSSISVSLEKVFNGLLKMNVYPSPGTDKIPNVFLIAVPFGIAKPLHIIFYKSLREGIFPEIWKSALVPLFLSPVMRYYHPIIIINSMPKLFEKIVCNKLRPVFFSFLSEAQHGFYPGRSTSTIVYLEIIYSHA